jgi:hypothetical protein
MMFEQKQNPFYPAVLAPGTTALLGSQVRVSFDRTWPIEEIHFYVDVTCGATGPTLSGVDNVMGIVKRFQLNIDDGVQRRTVVDASGIGMLEYVSQVAGNLDSATLEVIRLAQGSSIANNQKFRICYRIPLVNPMIGEPLRSQMLLPVNNYAQDPVLLVDFESSANMCSAGSFSVVAAHYVLIRREVSEGFNDKLLAIEKAGGIGYVPFDLLENPFSVPLSSAAQIRIPIPTPGMYQNLLFRQYLGGATVTRDVIDQTTTLGSETEWRLESGNVPKRLWRWKHLQTMNQWSRPLNVLSQTSSPAIGGSVASGTSYQPASSVMIDFLSDGLTGDTATELGSLLDCNLPAKAGLKMEVIGTPASVATNASVIYVMGHRLFGDLAKFQKV